MTFFKYLGYGWFILLAAILANGAVKQLGGTTWYDYIGNMPKVGVKAATASLNPLEALFLFVLYPGLFGLIVYMAVSRN